MLKRKYKGVTLWTLKDLSQNVNETSKCIDGKWVPARPMGYDSMFCKIKLAWGVILGKYDVVEWPEGQ